MCMVPFDGNKVQVCTVGDLKPGDQYRTPEGNDILITDYATTSLRTTVVNLQTGHVALEDNTIKLGRDRAGRLYASRCLNPPVPTTVTA